MAKVKADFTKVREGGGGIRVPEGDYRVTIVDSSVRDSQNGNSVIHWVMEFDDGKFEGKRIKDRTTLTEKAMWRLKKLIETTGQKVPRKVVKFDTRSLHGKRIGITVADREYEDDKGNSRVTSDVKDYIDYDAVGVRNDDDDDFEPKKSKKKGKGKKEPEPVKGKKGKKKGKKSKNDLESLDLADAFGD